MWKVKTGCLMVAVALMVMIATSPVSAGELDQKWLVELQIGMWSAGDKREVSVTPGTVTTNYDGNGVMGGIGFGRWLQEDVALVLSVRGLNVDGETTVSYLGVTNRNASVSFLGLGARYYPLRSSRESNIRPYLTLLAGPVFGYEGRNVSGLLVINEENTETALGGHVGVGVTFLLGRLVYMGAEAGASLMTDFQNQISDRINYSTGEFGLIVGVRF
jgi:hypothetical protein